MDVVWLLLGVVVLVGTLLDVFLTALNYDESGFLAAPVTRLQWRSLRAVTRRLPRRWRPTALRQVTGLQVVLTIVLWVVGTVVGYGLVYDGLMTPTSFSVSGTGASLDLFSALYFSAAQLSTVGGSSLTAETDLLRFLSITETLTGVLLLSLILTYLLGVYSVIGDLNSLCTRFVTAERGAGSAVASIAPYVRDGQPNGLDGHLDDIGDAFGSYTDGLRLHFAAYYFQSGRDQFALPYALRMTSGTVAALRWGLPTGHPGATLPRLEPLTFEVLEFGNYLQRRLRWTSTDVPEVVDADRFARLADGEVPDDASGVWAARFLQLDQDMAALAGVRPGADPDDTYRRYTGWLPFAYRSQQVSVAVARDLDYQPVIVTDRPVSILHPQGALSLRGVEEYLSGPPEPTRPDAAGRRALSRWHTFLREHVTQVDPGYARLRAATRALLAAVGAGLTGLLLLRALGEDVLTPALFGGFVGMLSAGIAVDRTVRARRATSVLLLVPVTVVVVLGALVSGSPVWTAVLVVAVAVAGTWMARYGPRWAALGRTTFMVYYFALILRLELSDVGSYLATAALGVAWGFLLTDVLLPERPVRVLRAGISGYQRELVALIDTLVDAVSWARWDPDVSKRVAVDQRRLTRGAAFMTGQLTGPPEVTGLDPRQAVRLRLRLLDTTLSASHLVGTARDVTGTAVSLELRGRLAGRLELLRAHLQQLAAGHDAARAGDALTPRVDPWDVPPPPAQWPAPARALWRSMNELYDVATGLSTTLHAVAGPAAGTGRAAATTPGVPVPAGSGAPDRRSADADADADADALEELDWDGADPQATGLHLSSVTRRSAQAGIAVGAALLIAELVSSSHQYWATLAAYQVLGGTDGETRLKGLQRVGGTVVGAVIGFGVAIWSGHEPWVLVPLLAVAVFAATYYTQVSPVAATLWRTMLFAVIYEFLGRLTPVALELRVLETLLGAAAAVVVAWLVLPTRTAAVLDKDTTQLVRDLAALVTTAVGHLASGRSVSTRAMRERVLVVEREARGVSATAAPLRRAAGASAAAGVEARLTALWALTYDTRYLVRNVEAAIHGGSAREAQDWAAVRATLQVNFTALLDVLAGRLPTEVRPDLPDTGRADLPAGSPLGSVARRLERINDTLVLLVQSASPGVPDRQEDGGLVDA